MRTGFTPNGTDGTPDPDYADARDRVRRQRSRHRRESWAGLRRRVARVGFVRGALNAIGLGCFALSAAMLHVIAGVAILGVGLLVYAWLLDDGRG